MAEEEAEEKAFDEKWEKEMLEDLIKLEIGEDLE
jgi:hypothetical protein